MNQQVPLGNRHSANGIAKLKLTVLFLLIFFVLDCAILRGTAAQTPEQVSADASQSAGAVNDESRKKQENSSAGNKAATTPEIQEAGSSAKQRKVDDADKATLPVSGEPVDAVDAKVQKQSDEPINGGRTKLEPFQLNVDKFGLKSGADRLNTTIMGNVSERGKFLSRYRIELIIDCSISMAERDCPGFTSRWSWCGAQANELAREVAPFAPEGLTITTFAWGHKVYENASLDVISKVFSKTRLGMGTRMAEPLSDRLKNFLDHENANQKPLLIVVITDGVPTPIYEPFMVARTITSASRKVSDPNRLMIVFFQIGSRDQIGRFFLSKLDTRRTSHGARFDIVRNVPFKVLQRDGLALSLVNAIQDFSGKQER